MPKSKEPTLKKVGVCLTPALIDHFHVDESIVVVIDVLRATSSICVALDYGVDSITPVVSIEEAKELMENQGYLGAAERNGEQIEGFHFGNSPYSFMEETLAGKKIAMTTTNGTKALHAARDRGAKEIVIGSFANISVLVRYLVEKNENVILLCAGWRDRPNLEDTIFAGAMVRKLRGHFKLHEDTALIAETLFQVANIRKRYFLFNSSHFSRMMHLQIQKDVKYCLRRDTHSVIPVLVGDELVLLENMKRAQKRWEKKQKELQNSGSLPENLSPDEKDPQKVLKEKIG